MSQAVVCPIYINIALTNMPSVCRVKQVLINGKPSSD